MSDSFVTIAPGVTRQQGDESYSYRLEGTKEAIVAARLVPESWFVATGERDKRGRMARSKRFQIEGGRVIETSVPAKGPAYVRFCSTEAEVQARQDRERAAADKELQRKAEDMELLELAWIPDSHKRFRELGVMRIEAMMTGPAYHLGRGLGGYRYAPETIDAFKEAIEEALQVLAEGKTLFDPDRHAQRVAEIRTQGAKADTGLQRFLEQAIGEQ